MAVNCCDIVGACLKSVYEVSLSYYNDLVVWLWTAVILLELVCRVYMKYHVSYFNDLVVWL